MKNKLLFISVMAFLVLGSSNIQAQENTNKTIINRGIMSPETTYWTIGGNNFSPNSNNKIGSINKYPIQICTHNISRIFIDSTGYVGINTTLPRQMLHVVDGNILISRTSTRADGSTNGSILFGNEVTTQVPYGKWGIEYLNQYIGNDLCQGLNFWRTSHNNQLLNFALFLCDDGNVGIGTSQPQAKLAVNGGILAKSIRISLESEYWPDYVFFDGYEMMSLYELEEYINNNKHLPGVLSAEEVRGNGDIDLGEMNMALLRKIEELTRYVIELQKQIDTLKNY